MRILAKAVFLMPGGTWAAIDGTYTVDSSFGAVVCGDGRALDIDGELDAPERVPVTGSPNADVLRIGDKIVFRSDCPPGYDGVPSPVQQMSTTAAISTTATVRLTPTGTYRKARISWVNNGASGSAKLNIAANASNDVEGLVASQSAKQRDAQMTMGDALLLVSPVPITSLNFSSDGAIASDAHRLLVTFGA